MTTTNNPDTDNVIEVYVHTEGVMDLQVLSVSRDGHVRDLLAPDESGHPSTQSGCQTKANRWTSIAR
ncbi:hypothetical protein [Candidatus Poriferisodalis sp.]|uniref:hypothetical protein n=1 Tax=Candidatus Poriferisodalis sp. TaxID=3101277 RepID=UPI003AF6F9A7